MNAFQTIVLASPVFFGLIALEWAWGQRLKARGTGHQTYRVNDALNSLGLGLMSQWASTVTVLLRLGVYAGVFEWLPLSRHEGVQAFWTSPLGWVLALVLYDFCYYWLHRMGHEVGVLWAAHVVHHQSQSYNLSTALRQTSSGMWLGWLFYLLMAALGVPPLVFAVVGLIDLLYQFWVHTEYVPRLGWFDRWFCSPSNHRVHHAVNDEYLDRNYGGILMVWDRLFGTFQDERDDLPCTYGTRSPLRSWDPLWANAEVYAALAQDSWRTRRWRDKLRVWLAPPGWRPADVAAAHPRAPFRLSDVTLYNPSIAPVDVAFSAIFFVVLLLMSMVFLWFAEGLSHGQRLMGVIALCALLWVQGAMLQGRWGQGAQARLLTGMLATGVLAAWASGMGWREAYALLKPLPLALGVAAVWVAGRRADAPQTDRWLMAAFAFSWLGDVALLGSGGFIAGLLAFLVAHVCFIVRLRQDLASPPGQAGQSSGRWAWPPLGFALGLLAYAGGMMAYLLHKGLPSALQIPVAAYMLALSLMVLAAVGRWWQRRSPSAARAAAGAVLFMASDSLLALEKFTHMNHLLGLPTGFCLLMAYFGGQWLMARGLLAEPTGTGFETRADLHPAGVAGSSRDAQPAPMAAPTASPQTPGAVSPR